MISASESSKNDQMPSAETVRLEGHGELTAERERLPRERDLFLEETRRLSMEVERLTEENAALRKSAEIWIRMYEGLLARAAGR